MHMKHIFILLIWLSYLITNTVIYAEPVYFDPNKDILIDDFQDAYGPEPYSNGRYWYSFGGLYIEANNKGLLVASGSSLPNWSGFGIEPLSNGGNGIVINANGKSLLCVEGSGTAPMLEIYDTQYKTQQNPATLLIVNGLITYKIPERFRNTNIAKLQFKFGPSNINLVIKRIYFTDNENSIKNTYEKK